MKYLCFCGVTSVMSKKGPPPPPNRFSDWVCRIVSVQFSPQSSSSYLVPGIVPEAGCVQISQVRALKSPQYFNRFLVSRCSVYLLKWNLPRSPRRELNCFKDASLSSWRCAPCVPRGIGDRMASCLQESKPQSTRLCPHGHSGGSWGGGGCVANDMYFQFVGMKNAGVFSVFPMWVTMEENAI